MSDLLTRIDRPGNDRFREDFRLKLVKEIADLTEGQGVYD